VHGAVIVLVIVGRTFPVGVLVTVYVTPPSFSTQTPFARLHVWLAPQSASQVHKPVRSVNSTDSEKALPQTRGVKASAKSESMGLISGVCRVVVGLGGSGTGYVLGELVLLGRLAPPSLAKSLGRLGRTPRPEIIFAIKGLGGKSPSITTIPGGFPEQSRGSGEGAIGVVRQWCTLRNLIGLVTEG
jgi:hypothetical protein